ncbi:Protein BASIC PENTACYSTEINE2-like [Sarracenia purpurea var. burkii]
MDDDGLNMRNWGFYPPSLKGHLGLQLMSSVTERDTKPFLSGHDHTDIVSSANGGFHPQDCMVSESPLHMDYATDNWVNQREKFLNMLPGNHPNFAFLPEPSSTNSMQILHPPDTSKDASAAIEDPTVCRNKKRTGGNTPKAPRPKKNKKGPSVPKDNNENSSVQRAKPSNKKSMDVVINGIDMDISGIPIPVCSCTGPPQQCYRWGCGGWQSACCTTTISIYPLPMSTKRRGARIAGRKMSQGAFKKVLEKLAAEGYNFSNPIDLRTHWAKHGTNKFVTIR